MSLPRLLASFPDSLWPCQTRCCHLRPTHACMEPCQAPTSIRLGSAAHDDGHARPVARRHLEAQHATVGGLELIGPSRGRICWQRDGHRLLLRRSLLRRHVLRGRLVVVLLLRGLVLVLLLRGPLLLLLRKHQRGELLLRVLLRHRSDRRVRSPFGCQAGPERALTTAE